LPSPYTLPEGDPIPDAFIAALQREERAGRITQAQRIAELQAARRGPNLPPVAFKILRKRSPNMATFGSAGASLSGGWGDVLNTGLSVLGQWAGAKAQRKAQKQQLKMMRQYAQLTGGGGIVATGMADPRIVYGQAANPMASITPSLGSTFNFASLTGPSLPTTASRGVWDLPSLPEVAEGVFDAIGEGAVSLGETIFGGGAPVATTTAVATRRASPPRIVGAIDNATGKSFFYRYVGAPILFRGDLTTLKTAKRAVSKFGGLVRTGGTFRRRRRC
jgi:hypothetical protein